MIMKVAEVQIALCGADRRAVREPARSVLRLEGGWLNAGVTADTREAKA